MKISRIKYKKDSIQNYRFLVQAGFVLLCLWIGVEMFLFVNFLETGGTGLYIPRPPGVDGFLPISSLMSLVLFIKTGIVHNAHPAGVFIFLGIILVSLVFGKSFCSWLCPVGFLSEMLADLGEKIFRRKIKMPKFLDYPLRSLKYLLLAFFLHSIFIAMSVMAIKVFLDSDYNKVADIKMYYFFAEISKFSFIVIAVLFFLSIIFRGFWCRYLCPYGALLGIASIFSPNKITRNVNSCTDCGLCSKVCPSFINVQKMKTVISDECTTCMNCVDVCPVNDTLHLQTVIIKKKFNKKYLAIAIAAIFIIITGIGMLTGNWQNNITKEEYLHHQRLLNSYGHPTDSKGLEELESRNRK
jgi:polyferredoxin